MMFLKSLGVNAVLIGEAFMEADDIASKMREIMRY
jgi:indole-3-glycerol phosphate synthase